MTTLGRMLDSLERLHTTALRDLGALAIHDDGTEVALLDLTDGVLVAMRALGARDEPLAGNAFWRAVEARHAILVRAVHHGMRLRPDGRMNAVGTLRLERAVRDALARNVVEVQPSDAFKAALEEVDALIARAEVLDAIKVQLVDRSGWSKGIWDREPDRVVFTHYGIGCLALRHPSLGHWCGYVSVPRWHAWYGIEPTCRVHGGVTYASTSAPDGSYTDDGSLWWVGFDCAHAGDLCPSIEASLRAASYAMQPSDETYKTLDYVRSELRELAEQAAQA